MLTLRNSAWAASRLVSPLATRSATLCSVGVRPTGPGARPPTLAISARALSAHRAAPSCSNDRQRPTERVPREPPLLRSAEGLALCEQRPPELEGLLQRGVMLQGPVERGERLGEFALRRGEQAPGPFGGGQRPRPPKRLGASEERFQERACSLRLSQGDERLDLIGQEPQHPGLTDPGLEYAFGERPEQAIGRLQRSPATVRGIRAPRG